MLRLPMLADGKTIDMNQTVDMVHRAIDGGVNYIDTGRCIWADRASWP